MMFEKINITLNETSLQVYFYSTYPRAEEEEGEEEGEEEEGNGEAEGEAKDVMARLANMIKRRRHKRNIEDELPSEEVRKGCCCCLQ